MLLVWSFGYYSTSNLKRHKSSLLYYVEAFLERGIGVNVVERAIIDHYIYIEYNYGISWSMHDILLPPLVINLCHCLSVWTKLSILILLIWCMVHLLWMNPCRCSWGRNDWQSPKNIYMGGYFGCHRVINWERKCSLSVNECMDLELAWQDIFCILIIIALICYHQSRKVS